MHQLDLFKKSMDEWSSKLKKDTSKILDNYEEIVLHHAKIVDELLKNYRQLAIETEKLIKYLNSVNFPARLDKLDTTVSSINQGLQNTQTRIGDLERNVKDDILSKNKELTSRIEKFQKSFSEKFQKQSEENKILKILLLVSVGLTVTLIILQFLSKI
jgi:hypothetical protein